MQILVVVVLYKQLPEQSETIQSLIRVFENDRASNPLFAFFYGTTALFRLPMSLSLFLSICVMPAGKM